MAKGRQQYFADEVSIQKDAREFAIEEALKEKIDSIEEGAQVNVIETVKVNGDPLVPDAEKAVDVSVPLVEDTLYSVDTEAALSARQGKVLYDYILNLQSRGRYLSNWNCATGLPTTNPSDSPYEYRAGDYFLVSNVSTGTNYRPDGTEYVIGTASTTVETEEVKVSDMYIYDGTTWQLILNTERPIAIDDALSPTSLNPVENRVVTQAIGTKQNIITDLQTIREGAAAGATALQPGDGLDQLSGTSDDITEGSSHLFMTPAERTKLGNQTGVNTGDETKQTIEAKLGAASASNNGYLSSTDWSTFNGKQDAIQDLQTIRDNATAGKNASDTIATYGDVVTHDASEFASSSDMTQAQSDITSLQGDMTQAQSDITSLQGDMTQAQSDITQNANDIIGLDTRLDNAEDDIDDLQSDMTTAQGDITQLQSDVAGKQDALDLGANLSWGQDGKLNATDTTYTAGPGISISQNNVITNTRNSAEWGNITGTLSNQTDLQDALDEKQDVLTAGDNITIEEVCSNDMQGPAPDGFHVPLTTEWQAVYDVWTALGGGSSDGTNFGMALKLPFTGDRSTANSNVRGQGTYGSYWSSSRYNGSYAYYLFFNSTTLIPQNNNNRTYGFSIRCFKNSPTVPTSSWTKLYGTSIEAGGIFWSSTDGLISLSSDGTNWITIADKNLGATTVWNSGDTLSEANSGKYYQWGNNYGFPFTGSVTTSSTQVDASNYGPGNYYESSTFITRSSSPFRWDTTDNGNLWGGVSQGQSCNLVISAQDLEEPVKIFTIYDDNNQGATWQAPLDWVLNGGEAIVKYINEEYDTVLHYRYQCPGPTYQIEEHNYSSHHFMYHSSNGDENDADWRVHSADVIVDDNNEVIAVNYYARAVPSDIDDRVSELEANVIYKYNTDPFTPVGDYNPATKKYVDDQVAAGSNTKTFFLSSASDLTTAQAAYDWIKASPTNMALIHYNDLVYSYAYELPEGVAGVTPGLEFYTSTEYIVGSFPEGGRSSIRLVTSNGTVTQIISTSPTAMKPLNRDNVYSYTPTGDYNPATKKYVDDSVNGKVSIGTNTTSGGFLYTIVDTETQAEAGFGADYMYVNSPSNGGASMMAGEVSAGDGSVDTSIGGSGVDIINRSDMLHTSLDMDKIHYSDDINGIYEDYEFTGGLDDQIARLKNVPYVGTSAPSNPVEGRLWYDTTNDVLKSYNGSSWEEAGTKMVVLSYGSSTWNDFINAYNKNAIVYCKASSNTDPGTGNQTRMAFMAYVDIASGQTTPRSVEFQYYRSRSDHNSEANQLDQVFVYKLTNAGAWSVTSRDTGALMKAGTNVSITWGNGKAIINSTDTTYTAGTGLNLNNGEFSVDTTTIATKSDIANFSGFQVVATLPTTDIKTNIIYLLGPLTTGVDKYEEYIYSNNAWILIGETSVDLTDYFNTVNDDSDDITEGSTHLFLTNAERTKLTNTTNVNSGDETKSTIQTKLGAASSSNSGYLTSTDWDTFNAKADAADTNTKTFYMPQSSSTTVAQDVLDWYLAGKNPIIIYNNNVYTLSGTGSNFINFSRYTGTSSGASDTSFSRDSVLITYSGTTVSSWNTTGSLWAPFLSTNSNYGTPYTPQYPGSPATKKYVDDSVSGKQDKATSGSTAPATTPSYVGQQYIDTTNDKMYVATGTSSSSDWTEVGAGGGDMNYSDYNWVTKSTTTFALDLATMHNPSANFTVNAPSTIKDGQVYVLRVYNGATTYTMTLGSNISNPFNVDLTLTASGIDQFVFLAVNGTLELQPEGGGGGGGGAITSNTTGTTTSISQIWVGTEAEYQALGTYEEGIAYMTF